MWNRLIQVKTAKCKNFLYFSKALKNLFQKPFFNQAEEKDILVESVI